MRPFFAALAGLSLLATACALPFDDGYDYGSVEVRVTDLGIRPIAGVSLALEAIDYRDLDYGVTGFDGHHRFERVPRGGRALRVEALPDGYELAPGERSRIPFAIAEGEDVFITIYLVETAPAG